MTLGLRTSTGTVHVPATIHHARNEGEPVCGTDADTDLVTADSEALGAEDVCGNCLDERPDYFNVENE